MRRGCDVADDLAVVKLDIDSLDEADTAVGVSPPVSRHYLEAIEFTGLGSAADWSAGDQVEVYGFGKSAGGSLDISLKRKASVTLVGECDEGYICFRFVAGSGDPAACEGDSGGPMLAGDDRVLISVARSSELGCVGGTSRYTDVTNSHHLDWLAAQMESSVTMPVSIFDEDPSLFSVDLPGELTGPNASASFTISLDEIEGEIRHLKLTLNYPPERKVDTARFPNLFSPSLESAGGQSVVCRFADYPGIGTCDVSDPARQAWSASVRAGQGSGHFSAHADRARPAATGRCRCALTAPTRVQC